MSFNLMLEGFLCLLATASAGLALIFDFISDKDWEKITGEHGTMFLLLCIILVVWNNGRIREKNENKRQERSARLLDARHAETLSLQREYAESIKTIQETSVQASQQTVSAIQTLSNNLQLQTIALKDCPFRAEDFVRLNKPTNTTPT